MIPKDDWVASIQEQVLVDRARSEMRKRFDEDFLAPLRAENAALRELLQVNAMLAAAKERSRCIAHNLPVIPNQASPVERTGRGRNWRRMSAAAGD